MMLTIFAKPNRRFHTDRGGLRFWLDPVAFQTVYSRHDESIALNTTSFSLNLIFEECDPGEGFRSYVHSIPVPEFCSSAVSAISPLVLQRAIIEVRFLSQQHQDVLADVERSFDHAELYVAISWTDQANSLFVQFVSWLAGSDAVMPERFWLEQVPDISLVRRVP